MKKHKEHGAPNNMHNKTPSYMGKMKNFENMKADMTPHVDDYQQPNSTFSQSQFGNTLEYIERKDKHLNENASDIKRQDYKGRYS
jgi:hypothetical protein